MNAVEIEEAVSALVEAPFDAEEFPYQFLAALGNKATTIKRLRTGSTNKSDVAGGVLQRNNIHIAVCDEGMVEATLPALHDSAATTSQKAKYILATDGKTVECERLADGETIASEYVDLADHFGFFLQLAGITKSEEIENNPFDVRATGRLNKLYVELLKENPDWEERREELNHFFARLIFCFFAEDTNIFQSDDQFTGAVEKMAASDSSNTHEVIAELFRAMNTKQDDREAEKIKRWASEFPYVNGGLFSGSLDVPRFSKIARSYLIHIGHLDWTKINPDIFGSMIQAVAEDEERGELGMHYTSVPNILKVLNPLFLDELREKLEEAGDGSDQGSKRKLLNLRNRMARIRVFDPACGSGNFLVIAYKEMRGIEAQINERRGETDRRSDLPLTNFRGIEIRHFAAEIARLALIIAEYQCDVLYRGPKLALAEFLPLEAANWIVHGNALRLDWQSVCPPSGLAVKVAGDDLFETPLDQAEIDFENEGGETYICGNPPYLGSTWQSKAQKADLRAIFEGRAKGWKTLDYVAGWFVKAAEYGTKTRMVAAFVATNSIAQGQQVPVLWPLVFSTGHQIVFAHTSFEWSNLAARKAGVTVVIVGISNHPPSSLSLYTAGDDGPVLQRVDHINAYLINGADVVVQKRSTPLAQLPEMDFGSKPVDGGNLLLTSPEANAIQQNDPRAHKFIFSYSNSKEFINGTQKFCLWIEDDEVEEAVSVGEIERRLNAVRLMRLDSDKKQTNESARTPHRFGEPRHRRYQSAFVIPRVSSERRPYLPVGILANSTVVGDRNFAMYDAPMWAMALIASRLHLVWIATVCVRMRMDFSYSNTLGRNTFPVPPLTKQNKDELDKAAFDIVLAREAAWPATIAEMYDPGRMGEEYSDLRSAHDRNDEILERIYIGRRFKNDTERLEKLFELYTKMTATSKSGKQGAEA